MNGQFIILIRLLMSQLQKLFLPFFKLLPNLTEIDRYLNRHYGISYDVDHEIMVTIGGSEAIDAAMRAMLDPGDEVLIPQPSYVSYVPCAVLEAEYRS